MSPRLWAAVGCLLAVGTAGCRTEPNRIVAYDLVERLGVAERWSARETLLFGTPSSEPHQVEGFYREAGGGDGDSFLWAREEAEVSLTWPEASPRAAVVDLAPYKGIVSPRVEVLLNGHRVGGFALNELRHRYLVGLPAADQRSGDNRLRFVFGVSASPAEEDPKNPDRRHLSAAFYSLTVGDASDAALEDLLGRDAPPPFSRVEVRGAPPALVEIGPSLVRYAVRLPAQAELRFAPDLHPQARAAAGSARFRVTLEERAGEVKEIWSRTISSGDSRPGEVMVPLPGAEGSIVRVGLEVGAAPGGRFAWGIWRAPRILGGGAPSTGPSPAPSNRTGSPGLNVVLIILDAGRAKELSCYGYSRSTTPAIDRIASEGVVFDDAFTPAVYTLGAMSSVWTSQYPDRHHSEVSFADRLPKDRLVLSEVLSASAIHTAGFVANAVAGSAFGFDRGFDEFHEVFKDLGSHASSFEKVLPPFLERMAGQRFFAYVHFREPHFPYDPPAPFDTRFGPDSPLSHASRSDMKFMTDINQGKRDLRPAEKDHLVRLYDGNLAFADEVIGKLRQTLERDGLWEKTALIIAADHGEELHEHGWIGHNVHVYEESARVPLVLLLPGGPKGIRVKGLVDLLDLAPTIADLFGVQGKGGSDKEFQGQSLLPRLQGDVPGKPAVMTRTVWDRPRYALRDQRFKFLYDTRTGEEALFDLQADPLETKDVRSTQPLEAAYDRQALHTWIAALSRNAHPGSKPAAPRPMTPAECENFKALGYLGPDYPCPRS